MASGSATEAYHSTLGVSAVDTVTLTTKAGFVDIISKTVANDIFVSVNPTDATQTPTDPTVGGNGFYLVSQLGERRLRIPLAGGGSSAGRAVIIKLISGGANTYTVQAGY
jgi:hypothetical protein